MHAVSCGALQRYMTEIIGVKFKTNGKVYSFAPGDLNPAEGTYVVVETARGPECGEVASRRHAVADESITAPLKPILRLATEEDLRVLERNKQYMADAFKICEERIQKRELPMRLVDVECGFDSNKLIFYFTAESRVDFRELVKDLASAFHVRIELRQIGDRDEAKLLGGLGICGREFCCKGYLSDFQPITIKMAKEQGLALNPAKISGTCGRLMCCLRYESPVYEELMRFTPKVGSTVVLQGEPPVRAYVMEANLITGKLRVKPENAEMPITVDRADVERLQDMTKRMTREDLRDNRRENGGRPTPAKPPAANLAAAEKQQPNPEQAAENAAEEVLDAELLALSDDAPVQQRPPKQPRPKRENNGNRLPRENANRPQKPQQQNPPQNRPAQPAAEPSALHSEFGESRQQQPVPTTVPRTTMPLDAMDLTEHRAAKPQSAEGEGNAQNHDNRSGNFNRRNGNNNQRPRQNRSNGNRNGENQQNGNGEHKPYRRNFNHGGGNRPSRPNRPPQDNGGEKSE